MRTDTSLVKQTSFRASLVVRGFDADANTLCAEIPGCVRPGVAVSEREREKTCSNLLHSVFEELDETFLE